MNILTEEDFLIFSLKYQVLFDTATGDPECDGDHGSWEAGAKMPYYAVLSSTQGVDFLHIRLYSADSGKCTYLGITATEFHASTFCYGNTMFLLRKKVAYAVHLPNDLKKILNRIIGLT